MYIVIACYVAELNVLHTIQLMHDTDNGPRVAKLSRHLITKSWPHSSKTRRWVAPHTSDKDQVIQRKPHVS